MWNEWMWKEKTNKRAAADSWCLLGNNVKGSMFLDHKIWGKYFDISSNQHLKTFTPSRGHFGWVLVLFLAFSFHPLLNLPPPCLNILHLFNYLAATLWFGPELQWKLYLQIRVGLVTGAGHISLSRCCLRERDAFGHITQEEMSLPHCRLVISSLWSLREQRGFVCVWRCVSV